MKNKMYLVLTLLCILLLAGAVCAEPILVSSTEQSNDPQELAIGEGNQAEIESIPTIAPEGKQPPSAALATPVLISPANNVLLKHYPRTTTLAWRPVPGATAYKVERWYYSSSWVAYPVVTVYGNTNTHYTFNFIGDQPGAWRITALGSTNSAASAPWYFNYRTKPQLPTPALVAPVNNTHFYHYPRVTTLTWKPVPGASGYSVERAYYDPGGKTWKPYTPVTVPGVLNCSYQFTFIGDQPGRWRVTAISSSGAFYNSAPSGWLQFDYSTSKPALQTPVMVSPLNNAHFYHFPRVTTLTWKPVAGAVGYMVERAYYSGGTWTAYPTVTVNGNMNTAYTFSFIGDQPGRWRVTALAAGDAKNSAASAFWTFDYNTKPTLTAPYPISPANATTFYHYPRTTTLAWNPVPGATSYVVRRWYYAGGTWYAYSPPTYTVPGVYNASFTFNFVGAQPGRWDVKAVGGGFYDSPTSVLRYFSYTI